VVTLFSVEPGSAEDRRQEVHVDVGHRAEDRLPPTGLELRDRQIQQ
jgi:hypothetical protein